jgi:hypothetical protein
LAIGIERKGEELLMRERLVVCEVDRVLGCVDVGVSALTSLALLVSLALASVLPVSPLPPNMLVAVTCDSDIVTVVVYEPIAVGVSVTETVAVAREGFHAGSCG